MAKKVLVECSYFLELEFEDIDTDEHILFLVEENNCPGTGSAGTALEKLMDMHAEQGTCWGCAARGKCKVININGITREQSEHTTIHNRRTTSNSKSSREV